MEERKESNTVKVIKGMSAQTLITVVLGFLEIISFSIMSRLLTEKDFGYYAAIIAIVAVFQSLAETGIGAAVIQRKDLTDRYINCAFTMSLIVGGVVSTMLFASAGVVSKFVADETMTVPLRVISVTLLCNCLTSVNISLLHRNLHFIKTGAISIISLVTTTVVAMILAIKGFGYYAIIAKGVLASIVSLVLSYFVVRFKYRCVLDIKTYREIFGFGGWLMAAALFRNMASQVDRLVMTSLFSIQTLGEYTRPKELISTLAGKCNSIFDTVLFPVLSTMQDSKERLRNSFNRACFSLNLFAAVLGVMFLCNSEMLICIFLGDKWLGVNKLFKVFSLYPVLLINGRMCDIFLRSLGMTRQQFIFRVGQLAIAVAFILASYKFGIVALAFAVMISYGFITVLKFFYVTNKMGVNGRTTICTIFASYRFIVFLFPVYVIFHSILPNTWIGNAMQAMVLAVCLLLLFLLFPGVVGKQYKEDVHAIVMNYTRKYLLKNDRPRSA